MCAALGDERVRVLALHLESTGVLRLIVDNPVRATGTLRERRHEVVEKEVAVVVLSNAPGSLASVLSLVSCASSSRAPYPDPRFLWRLRKFSKHWTITR